MRKTLVILTPGFPKNEDDTACMPSIQVFLRALKTAYPELNLTVLTFQYPFSAANYQWHGVNVIAFGGRSRGKGFRLFIWLKVWKKLLDLKKKQRVIGLLSFWLGECALVGSAFARLHGLKHYCWLLGQDARAGNKYMKWVKTNGSDLIALSDSLAGELNKNYHIMPANVIPIGIDAELFSNITVERDIDVLGAGSLIPLKQYAVFVEIIGRLKNDFPEIKAVICGKGPEMEMLQAKIKRLGLENNLTLAGELPHAEVLALMQRTKVFMHTSNYEGFGYVCIEALYGGARVVSFVRPMNEVILNWHIAADGAWMQQLAATIMNENNGDYNPVLPYRAGETAKAVVKLFDQQEAAIS
jgi:glycosyltransferase involved in cell wall biosynthesis